MQVGTRIGLAFALLATTSIAAGGLLAPAATGSPDPSGWSEVAQMFHREPGAEFSDAQLDEARSLLYAELANRSVSASEGSPQIDLKEPGGGSGGGGGGGASGGGKSCSIHCGDGCGSCQASASCDAAACSCSCGCEKVGECTNCGWCGCEWCGETVADYDCHASCSGVGGSSEVASEVTIDGENGFTADDFADWTTQEDGNASVVLDGLVQVASKDIAGRQIADTNADLAADTWADVVVAYMEWYTHSN